MDKDWMAIKNRLSEQYKQGVESFIEFAMANSGAQAEIRCPCIDCLHSKTLSSEVFRIHLIIKGINSSYKTWMYHGEPVPARHPQTQYDDYHEHNEGIGDQIGREVPEDDNQLHDMLEQSIVGGKLGNETLDMIMKIIKEMLPVDREIESTITWTIYDAKKFLRDLGLGYMPIHACKYEYDEELRHPTDGQEWKDFDEHFPDFAAEPRNVRLGMATDEIFDVYLRPLVDELNVLWKDGAYPPFGKHPNKSRKRKRDEYENNLNWSKKSILFELPYAPFLNLRHNLDPMHIGKNICDNLVGTSLGIDGKNKDTARARKDMEDQEIQKELHPKRHANGTFEKPLSMCTLSSTEREGFCDFLKSIKYPDGCAANISKCMNTHGGKLSGLKSHDCHVLVQ
ncbi:hypothetical protein RHSIM_Rhsim10G0071800 [Rhododendron simsii]|uniref:Transposase-associated domain-containing protein n=1 Tax=Rhododendron simsii TaxID=118357 RepID=A0A834GEY9_RHOSS|nr:hypothetical protein RHSIM_Rhsim10G0071800 [Rhododendron simsii]